MFYTLLYAYRLLSWLFKDCCPFRLQRTIQAVERNIAAELPTIEDLYQSRVRKREAIIALDPSHPGHKLFNLLHWFAKNQLTQSQLLSQSSDSVERSEVAPTLSLNKGYQPCSASTSCIFQIPILLLTYCQCTELPCTIFIFIFKS